MSTSFKELDAKLEELKKAIDSDSSGKPPKKTRDLSGAAFYNQEASPSSTIKFGEERVESKTAPAGSNSNLKQDADKLLREDKSSIPKVKQESSSPKKSTSPLSEIGKPVKKEKNPYSESSVPTIKFGEEPINTKAPTDSSRLSATKDANKFMKEKGDEESENFKHSEGPFKGKFKYDINNSKMFPSVDKDQKEAYDRFKGKGYSEGESIYMAGIRPKNAKNTGTPLFDHHEFGTEMPSKSMMDLLRPHAHSLIRNDYLDTIKNVDPEEHLNRANQKSSMDLYDAHSGKMQSEIDKFKSSPEYQNMKPHERMSQISEIQNKHDIGGLAQKHSQDYLDHVARNKDTYFAGQHNKINDYLSAGGDTVDAAAAAQDLGFKSGSEEGTKTMNTEGLAAGKFDERLTASSQKMKDMAKKYEGKLSPAALESLQSKKLEGRDDADELNEGMTNKDRIRHFVHIANSLGLKDIDEDYLDGKLPSRIPRHMERAWNEQKDNFSPEVRNLHEKTLNFIRNKKGQDSDIEKSLQQFESLEDYLGGNRG